MDSSIIYPILIVVVFVSTIAASIVMAYLNTQKQRAQKETRQLMEQSLALQKETNQLLAQLVPSQKAAQSQ